MIATAEFVQEKINSKSTISYMVGRGKYSQLKKGIPTSITEQGIISVKSGGDTYDVNLCKVIAE